jgi:UDP-N-acetylglucosamine pyrophosphorylase
VISFLKKKNFFEMNNLCVCFQDDLAIVNKKGKIVLKDETSILKCPNGSGGVFKTILKYELSKFSCFHNSIMIK